MLIYTRIIIDVSNESLIHHSIIFQLSMENLLCNNDYVISLHHIFLHRISLLMNTYNVDMHNKNAWRERGAGWERSGYSM